MVDLRRPDARRSRAPPGRGRWPRRRRSRWTAARRRGARFASLPHPPGAGQGPSVRTVRGWSPAPSPPTVPPPPRQPPRSWPFTRAVASALEHNFGTSPWSSASKGRSSPLRHQGPMLRELTRATCAALAEVRVWDRLTASPGRLRPLGSTTRWSTGGDDRVPAQVRRGHPAWRPRRRCGTSTASWWSAPGRGTAAGEFRPGDDRCAPPALRVHWMWTWFDPAAPHAAGGASFVDTFLGGSHRSGRGRGLGDPAGTVARSWPRRSRRREPGVDGGAVHPRLTVRAVRAIAGARRCRVPDRSVLTDLLADLAAEGAALDAVVAELEDTAWLGPTPGRGLDRRPPDRPPRLDRRAGAARGDRSRGLHGRRRRGRTRGWPLVDDAAGAGAAERRSAAGRWRAGRAGSPTGWPPARRDEAAVVRAADERRLDGHRPADGDLGARSRRHRRAAPPPSVSARLRHVAHIGVRTRDFAFAQHGLPAPDEPFRVELTAPDGGTWAWGPEDAAQRVTGPALDFCLRVTQRRHRDDLALPPSGRTPTAGWTSPRPSPGRRARAAGLGDAGVTVRRCGSATPRGSTATGGPRSARCSRAGRSTSSPATTSPS